MAQDSTSTTDKKLSDDPEIAALEKKARLAELKKQIATDSQAALTAQLPSSETKGKEGKVEFKDKAGYYAEILAYEALQEAASRVAGRLGKASRKILLTPQSDLGARAQLWHLIDLRLDEHASWFDQLLEVYTPVDPKGGPSAALASMAVVGTVLSALPGVLGAVADIAAFFRTNTQVFGREVALADEAVLGEVAQALEKLGWQVHLPSFDVATRGQLVARIEGLLAKKAEVRQRRFELESAIELQLARLEELRLDKEHAEERLVDLQKAQPPDPDAVAGLKQKIRDLAQEIQPLARVETRWKAIAARFDAALEAFDTLVTSLNQGSDGAPSPLEAVADIDRLQALGIDELLSVKVVSQGSEIHVAEGSFNTRLTYLGGVVLAFFHLNRGGEVIDAGTVTTRRARSGKQSDFPKLSLVGES